jgi:hypothetical protein
MQTDLLAEIRTFLARSGMGPSYFGQKAVRNPHLVKRLERGKTVTLDTAERVRTFIAQKQKERAQ